jgi:decaprenylphospho-beta-D-ribofuranose 2-oxidase
MSETTRLLTGWGRTAPTASRVLTGPTAESLAEAVRSAGPRGVIARGLGRAYGDAAQNAGGLVVDMTGLNRIHRIDVDSALVTVDAGVSLETLMRRLLPLGLWVPVSPGTRFVTVGGAIASDIHGKNHHRDGSFGQHVVSMDLLTASGEVRTLRPDGPDADAELFWATVGGMGLTGIVLCATIRFKPAETAYFVVDTERTADLDDLMDRLERTDHRYPYSVAWIDTVATGARMGRAVLTRGWPARLEDLPRRLRRDPLRFDPRQILPRTPAVFPSGLLNNLTVSAFNEVWYRKAPRDRRAEIQHITPFFHPLDMIADWNVIYGPRGFLQYQFVVPFQAQDAMRRALEKISASGHVSFLSVLKRFGEADPAPLSFPAPGWTLALDLPVGGDLGALLDSLDQLVLDAGGRVYLTKDSRLTADTLQRMYPRIDEWRKTRAAADPQGVFSSDLSRRLAL